LQGDELCAGVHVVGWIIALLVACVAGQRLTDAVGSAQHSLLCLTAMFQSESIFDAIWMSKWYQADLRLKKDILFLLACSQKKLYITVGPFGVLSFELFVSVIELLRLLCVNCCR
jgi:hypothetical protein